MSKGWDGSSKSITLAHSDRRTVLERVGFDLDEEWPCGLSRGVWDSAGGARPVGRSLVSCVAISMAYALGLANKGAWEGESGLEGECAREGDGEVRAANLLGSGICR